MELFCPTSHKIHTASCSWKSWSIEQMTPTIDVVDDILRFLVFDVVLLNPNPSPSSDSPAIVQVLAIDHKVNSRIFFRVNKTDDSLAAS